MRTKLLDRLTGAQITLIALALIAAFVPGSLYAVAAFTNVAIQDPITGARARIDSSGRFSVVPSDANHYAYYKDNPGYKVKIYFSPDSNGVIYTVPSGYYFVVQGISGILGCDAGYSSCGFYLVTQYEVVSATATPTSGLYPISQTFGSGERLYGGDAISVDSRSAGNTGMFLHGYLVPYSIPSSAPAQATAQNEALPPVAVTNVNAVTRGAGMITLGAPPQPALTRR